MDKQLMRAWLKSKRLAMYKDEISSRSETICKKLLQIINTDSVKTINCFQAINSLNEVDLSYFTKEISKSSGISVSVQDKTAKEEIHPTYDVIIVPTLGFDGRGYRIGWGGGFYDKFLSTQKQATKIGVAFSNGYVRKISEERHDVPLDIIVTENKVYKFNKK